MSDLESMSKYLMQQSKIADATNILKQRFSDDELERIRKAVLARSDGSVIPNSDNYLSGMRMAVFMSNDGKPFQEIIDKLSEIPRGFMLRLTEAQQSSIDWFRGNIKELGEGKYRLVTDYRDESPSYDFEAEELETILEKAAEDYAVWDEI